MVGSYVSGLIGGSLIGLAAAVLFLANGRVAGISGIVAGLLGPRDGELAWRALFVAGLVAGGLVARAVAPGSIGGIATPVPLLALAGILVGFGTRLGGGCTSGHGVCGIGRLSPRSILATGTFIFAAAVVVFVMRRAVSG